MILTTPTRPTHNPRTHPKAARAPKLLASSACDSQCTMPPKAINKYTQRRAEEMRPRKRTKRQIEIEEERSLRIWRQRELADRAKREVLIEMAQKDITELKNRYEKYLTYLEKKHPVYRKYLLLSSNKITTGPLDDAIGLEVWEKRYLKILFDVRDGLASAEHDCGLTAARLKKNERHAKRPRLALRSITSTLAS